MKLKSGVLDVDDELMVELKKRIRSGASPRHVPAKIIAVPDVPYTLSGKKVEIAVKDILRGRSPKNVEALANPDSLKFFKEISFEKC